MLLSPYKGLIIAINKYSYRVTICIFMLENMKILLSYLRSQETILYYPVQPTR